MIGNYRGIMNPTRLMAYRPWGGGINQINTFTFHNGGVNTCSCNEGNTSMTPFWLSFGLSALLGMLPAFFGGKKDDAADGTKASDGTKQESQNLQNLRTLYSGYTFVENEDGTFTAVKKGTTETIEGTYDQIKGIISGKVEEDYTAAMNNFNNGFGKTYGATMTKDEATGQYVITASDNKKYKGDTPDEALALFNAQVGAAAYTPVNGVVNNNNAGDAHQDEINEANTLQNTLRTLNPNVQDLNVQYDAASDEFVATWKDANGNVVTVRKADISELKAAVKQAGLTTEAVQNQGQVQGGGNAVQGSGASQGSGHSSGSSGSSFTYPTLAEGLEWKAAHKSEYLGKTVEELITILGRGGISPVSKEQLIGANPNAIKLQNGRYVVVDTSQLDLPAVKGGNRVSTSTGNFDDIKNTIAGYPDVTNVSITQSGNNITLTCKYKGKDISVTVEDKNKIMNEFFKARNKLNQPDYSTVQGRQSYTGQISMRCTLVPRGGNTTYQFEVTLPTGKVTKSAEGQSSYGAKKALIQQLKNEGWTHAQYR